MFSAADLIIVVLGPTKVIEPSTSRRPRSFVWCQPPRLPYRREVRTVAVAGHHDRPPDDDLAHLTGRQLAAVLVDDPHLRQRMGPPVRPERVTTDALVRDHADDLGLAVATRSLQPAGSARPASQGAQVEATVAVELRRSADGSAARDTRPVQRSAFDQPAHLLGVDAPDEHVRAPGMERRQRVPERADVEQRAEFRYTSAAVTCCRPITTRFWAMMPAWVRSAPLGVPSKAAV